MRNTARVRTSSTHRRANKRRASGSASRRRGFDSKGKRSMNEHQARQFADRATRTARDTIQKSTEAVEQSTRGAERSYFAAAEAARDFNITVTQMVQSNTIATINFAWELATARNPTQAAAVLYYHAHKNFETLLEQSRQLTAFAQRLMTFAEPLPPSFRQTDTSFSRPFLKLVTP